MKANIIYTDDDGVEYIIEGEVEPYVPAKLYGHPDDWHPAEGGGVCDIEVWEMDAKGNKGESIAYEDFLKKPGVKADDIDEQLFQATQDDYDDDSYEPEDYLNDD